jgi:hypothetical protein
MPASDIDAGAEAGGEDEDQDENVEKAPVSFSRRFALIKYVLLITFPTIPAPSSIPSCLRNSIRASTIH